MNIYQLMDDLYTRYAYLSAGGDDNEWPFTPILELFEAYYRLEPSPNDWPKWANWFTIDADGSGYWHDAEPAIQGLCWCSGTAESANHYLLAPGISWELCKWPKPEGD